MNAQLREALVAAAKDPALDVPSYFRDDLIVAAYDLARCPEAAAAWRRALVEHTDEQGSAL